MRACAVHTVAPHRRFSSGRRVHRTSKHMYCTSLKVSPVLPVGAFLRQKTQKEKKYLFGSRSEDMNEARGPRSLPPPSLPIFSSRLGPGILLFPVWPIDLLHSWQRHTPAPAHTQQRETSTAADENQGDRVGSSLSDEIVLVSLARSAVSFFSQKEHPRTGPTRHIYLRGGRVRVRSRARRRGQKHRARLVAA